MARHRDDSLKYYNRDVYDEDNLQYIQSAHGIIGWAIVEKLRQKVYSSPGGYFMAWNAVTERIFCSNNKIDLDVFKEVLESCFLPEISLFDKEMYDQHCILTSRGIQKRWLKIVTECKRKYSVLNPEYCLIQDVLSSNSSGESEVTPEILQNSSGASTQIKLNKTKVKESNKDRVLPKESFPKEAPPAPATAGAGEKKNLEKNKEKIRPFWQEFVDTFTDFYKKNINPDGPTFVGKNQNMSQMGKLYDMLCARAAKKNQQWTQEHAIGSLNFFLSTAVKISFLEKNFLLAHLVDRFDVVYASKKEEPAAKQKGFNDELAYLVGRFAEPDFDDRLLTPELYSKMERHKIIPEGYMNQFEGATSDEKAANAIREWLRVQSEALVN